MRGGPQGQGNSASNFGDWNPRNGQIQDPQTRAQMERALQESLKQIPGLANDLRRNGVFDEDLEALRRFVRGLPSSNFQNNPELLAREYSQLVGLLEQLELQLRRQVEQDGGGEVRAVVSEPVPEQYRNAVAEYFRKLSDNKED